MKGKFKCELILRIKSTLTVFQYLQLTIIQVFRHRIAPVDDVALFLRQQKEMCPSFSNSSIIYVEISIN